MGVGYFNRIRSNDTYFSAIILDCTTLVNDTKEPVLDNFCNLMLDMRWNLHFDDFVLLFS